MCVPVSAQHKLGSAVSKASLLADFTRECCRSSDLFALAESLSSGAAKAPFTTCLGMPAFDKRC